MPPHIFDADCETASMGQLFNSLLSSSLNTLTPMCNDSAVGPTCNDSSPMCDDSHRRQPSPAYERQTSTVAKDGASCAPKDLAAGRGKPSVSVATAPDPRRPPRNPTKPKPSYRDRKRPGLSITVPPPSADPHNIPSPMHENPPPRISCIRNVELRRKSLSERHFFRPVSEDEESAFGTRQ